ncbi:prophage tail fiber N-terminal domain-containing protein, partial [Escherichia coli]
TDIIFTVKPWPVLLDHYILGAMTEDDARPEALRRFELMVEEVARNASAVAQNTAAAKKSASDASTSAR